jgi:hypothetical protein
MVMLEQRMFSLRHGYLAHNEPVSNHVNFNTQLKDCYHPWSMRSFGHTFGMREYKNFMSLHDYMHMPMDIMEDLVEGVIKGEADLAEAKRKAAEKAARAAGGVTDPTKAAINNANREEKRHG